MENENNSPESSSGDSTNSDGAAVSQSEIRNAVSTAATTNNVDANNMTPQQLVELINALPDRIVDAIKEATQTKAPAGNSQGNAQAVDNPVEKSKSGLFGGKSFGEWWTS